MKWIGSNGKYFCAVATLNREKSKEEEEELIQFYSGSSDFFNQSRIQYI